MTQVQTVSFDEAALRLIEEHVRRLLDVMGFGGVGVVCRYESGAEESRDNLYIDLSAADDSKLLIGPRGAHLFALQHVVRCLLRQSLQGDMVVLVDVNGYRLKRQRALASLARDAASRALAQGRTVVLRVMPASDRRLIHTALADRSDIKTESMGDEPNRRVVIKPRFI